MKRIIQRFKDITQEENWIIKIVVGGILFCIPILNAISFGYLMDLLDDVKEKRVLRLSKDWKNFERLFKEGLPLALAMIVLIVTTFIVQILLEVFPFCLGLILILVLNLTIVVCMPMFFTILAYRLREYQTWQEAAQIGAIVNTIKKDFKHYLPFSLGLLLCSVLSIIVGCCLFASIPYFLCCVVFYPFFGEIYTGNEMLTTQVEQQPAKEE